MKNYFNGHSEVVYAMNGMENNITLFLQIAGVHQGLQYQTKVVDKDMRRCGFDRNKNSIAYVGCNIPSAQTLLSMQLFTV